MSGGFDSFEGSPSPVPGRVRIQSGPIAGPAGSNGGASPEASLESVFEAREVSVYYGRKRALAAVNLRIPRNRITALIGPSG
jgi:ABC-type multidrug transport system fused ATPase/permease subunit